ncbi:hypothetical protein BSZ32_06110 [Rubritalea profundi]|uniref:Uncharacterized protein n=1 Tax=Rubritalea profundi TaxID=1658618 RepID=A0A2S7U0T5_9BACT|nr:hypothetical protein BSZ32_06110 [Rubritalea profundi]
MPLVTFDFDCFDEITGRLADKCRSKYRFRKVIASVYVDAASGCHVCQFTILIERALHVGSVYAGSDTDWVGFVRPNAV